MAARCFDDHRRPRRRKGAAHQRCRRHHREGARRGLRCGEHPALRVRTAHGVSGAVRRGAARAAAMKPPLEVRWAFPECQPGRS